MSNQSLTPPFGPQDVEVLERETPFQGFFRVDTLTLRHKHYNGGWGEPVRRGLFVRPPAAAALRGTVRCVAGVPALVRHRWRRSWRASWASTSA